MKTAISFRLTPLAAALLASFSAQAQLPTNPVLVNGSATINETAMGLRVTNLPGTILNWDSFNIGANRSVEFAQISAGSAVMNRVTGNTRSEILGALTSNGRVFLLNPNGVLFGNGARVDVQGLVASTLDLSNEDFLAGNYNFVCTNDVACDFGAPDALNPTRNRIVLEDGSEITTRTAGNGGQVWLIARGAVQTETGSRIDAPLGQVALAAGREVIVTSPSLGAITFTLDRIAGSQIDLAGDIDVERGAAAFFADSIRFAGNVRVPSATDGAGQIVASAGTRVDVDDDARLNISGDANADGGAVRLQATQTIRVSAAAEIEADGGDFTAAAPGGRGGVITLEAGEVILPGQLGSSRGDRGPIQLHARGQGQTGLELERYGRIAVTETGEFEFALVEGPSFTTEVTTDFQGNQTITPSLFSSSSTNTRTERGEEIFDFAAAGDGSLLVVTRLVTADSSSTNTLINRGQGEERTFDASNTGTRIYRFHLLDAAGALTTTVTLAADDAGLVNNYSALGLTRGGWVLTESVSQPQVSTQQLAFVSASGEILNRVALSGGSPSLEALLNGSVLLTERIDGVDVLRVFDAQGRPAPDTAIALAGLDRTRPLAGSLRGIPEQFDERRLVTIIASETSNLGLGRLDLVTNLPDENLAALPQTGYVIDQANFSETDVGFGDNRSTSYSFDVGAYEADGFTAVVNVLGTSQRTDITSGGTTTRTRDVTDRFFNPQRGLNSNQISVLDIGRTENRRELNVITTRSPTESDTVNTASSSLTTRGTLSQIVRTLSTTPVAAQSIAASYLALAGAASTPGRSNGAFAPPLPPSPPPVVTPPSPPPVTPPSPPPVTPPSPPPVTPPAPPPVAPPAPPAVTPPSPGGVSLPIRPPQTVVPPLGNSQPTPPNTARPRGPSSGDIGGREKDVLEAAAKAEADLVRELVCSELSAADCLKFDTGLSDIKQDMVDKVTRKQLSGPYWEVIDDMEVPTIHAFFQAIGDLQTNGELDEELRGGLDDALFKRPVGPDGKPGDSALDRTLGVYDLLVKQARTPEEKEQLRRDFAEDLLDAAKKQVASREPPPPAAPPPPGADVTNDSILADEAQIQADVKAQNEARAAEAAAEAANPGTPPPP